MSGRETVKNRITDCLIISSRQCAGQPLLVRQAVVPGGCEHGRSTIATGRVTTAGRAFRTSRRSRSACVHSECTRLRSVVKRRKLELELGQPKRRPRLVGDRKRHALGRRLREMAKRLPIFLFNVALSSLAHREEEDEGYTRNDARAQTRRKLRSSPWLLSSSSFLRGRLPPGSCLRPARVGESCSA